jgi:hypothetical protein
LKPATFAAGLLRPENEAGRSPVIASGFAAIAVEMTKWGRAYAPSRAYRAAPPGVAMKRECRPRAVIRGLRVADAFLRRRQAAARISWRRRMVKIVKD